MHVKSSSGKIFEARENHVSVPYTSIELDPIPTRLLSICRLRVNGDGRCREWTEGGQLWVQQVSSTPATRLDVITLQEELDRRLQQRQARETGICPVRRELYSQCFGKSFIQSQHVSARCSGVID